MRSDGRADDQVRPIEITRGFTAAPAGSVLWKQGHTIVLATASIVRELPPWMKESQPGGWVTANYVMLPGSTPQRKGWAKTGHTDSRGTEIERMIGRSLRAVVDLTRIGPHTLTVDCQVLQADGGTRTASICAGFVALRDAIGKLPGSAVEIPGMLVEATGSVSIPARYDARYYDPRGALVDRLAAVSVGLIDGVARLDLHYDDDAHANVDMNVAMTAGGRFVEFQASAENGQGFDSSALARLTELAVAGCRRIFSIIG